MISAVETTRFKHGECEHCRHEIAEIIRPSPPKISNHEDAVLDILRIYKHRQLTRAQIGKASGLTATEAMNALRSLVHQNKVAYAGAAIESRNAKYKLFGATVWKVV